MFPQEHVLHIFSLSCIGFLLLHELKLCVTTFKAFKYGEPGHLAGPLVCDSNVELRSGDDPLCMDELRAVGGHSFAAQFFLLFAPRLYNRLSIELKSIAFVDSFKECLKTFVL